MLSIACTAWNQSTNTATIVHVFENKDDGFAKFYWPPADWYRACLMHAAYQCRHWRQSSVSKQTIASGVVLKARPWPRGASRPNFMALALEPMALASALVWDSCTDNFSAFGNDKSWLGWLCPPLDRTRQKWWLSEKGVWVKLSPLSPTYRSRDTAHA